MNQKKFLDSSWITKFLSMAAPTFMFANFLLPMLRGFEGCTPPLKKSRIGVREGRFNWSGVSYRQQLPFMTESQRGFS